MAQNFLLHIKMQSLPTFYTNIFGAITARKQYGNEVEIWRLNSMMPEILPYDILKLDMWCHRVYHIKEKEFLDTQDTFGLVLTRYLTRDDNNCYWVKLTPKMQEIH